MESEEKTMLLSVFGAFIFVLGVALTDSGFINTIGIIIMFFGASIEMYLWHEQRIEALTQTRDSKNIKESG